MSQETFHFTIQFCFNEYPTNLIVLEPVSSLNANEVEGKIGSLYECLTKEQKRERGRKRERGYARARKRESLCIWSFDSLEIATKLSTNDNPVS